MGKRSDFKRNKNDLYRTPLKPVLHLLPHLAPGTRFVEPCAGHGDLIDHLTAYGHECVHACDIEPNRDDIAHGDAIWCDLHDADMFITNPPWSRCLLHPIIECLAHKAPTWLLFDADWLHTIQSIPYVSLLLRKFVPVGRVRWVVGTKMDGKDNAAWYLFDAKGSGCVLYPRAKVQVPKFIWPWQK